MRWPSSRPVVPGPPASSEHLNHTYALQLMHLTCPIGLGPDGLLGFLTGLSRRDKIEKDNKNNPSKNASIVQIPVSGEWKTSGLPRTNYSSPCKLETHLEFPFLHASGNQTGSLCHGGGPLRPPVQHCRKAQVWLCTHSRSQRRKTPDPLSRWLAADPDPVTGAVAASGSRASLYCTFLAFSIFNFA